MPNKLYALLRSTGFFILYGIGLSFSHIVHIYEFGKNANSIYVDVIIRTAYKLVWRQSEFAFFVRWLWLAHFFISFQLRR